MHGSTTVSVIAVASAASTALPPRRYIARPGGRRQRLRGADHIGGQQRHALRDIGERPERGIERHEAGFLFTAADSTRFDPWRYRLMGVVSVISASTTREADEQRPPHERALRSPDPPLPAVAAGHARPDLRQLRRAVALVGHRSRRLLAEHLGLFRDPVADAAQRGAGAPRHAGRGWFPGAQVNYARQVFRHVDAAEQAGLPAVVSRNEKGAHRELSWPELRRQVRVAGAASEGAGRAARRPRRGLPAQHPRDDDRLPRHRQHRRRVEPVRARHGHGRGARPLPADRAQGADRLRRRQLRRQGPRPHAGGARNCARRCRACSI